MISRQYVTVGASSAATSLHTASREAVTKYPAISSKLRVKASEETGAQIARFLRARHPRKTAEMVAADTGLAVSTIATWLEGRSVPGGVAFVTLIAAYGPEFLAGVMPRSCGWLAEAARVERQAKLEAEIEERRRALKALRP